MTMTVDKKIFDTDSKRLAGLIGNDDVGERIWTADELAEILRHQLTTPLHIDLANIGGTAGKLAKTAETRGLLLQSFGDLLRHKRPPVALLKTMKDFAKACRIGSESALPHEISTVLYYASILVAMMRCSRRITRLDKAALLDATQWALEQPWLDDTLRDIFREGRTYLTAGRGTEATKSGEARS